MASTNSASGRKRAHNSGGKATGRGSSIVPALCNVVGTLLLVLVIALCVPLTVPRVMGYELYDVVSGSMEPELPVGSAVLVKPINPSEIQEGDIVAFYDVGGTVTESGGANGANGSGGDGGASGSGGSESDGAQSGSTAGAGSDSESVWRPPVGEDSLIVVHRVVTNRTSLGEFVTKGDANNVEDFNPIPYDNVIGRVEMNMPMVGTFMAIYASTVGKVYLLLTAACGVMLNMLASRMRAKRREREREIAEAAVEMGLTPEAATAMLREGGKAHLAPSASGSRGETHVAGSDGEGSRAAGSHGKAGGSGASGKRRGGMLRAALIAVLAVIFLGSAGVIGYVNWQYHISDALYHDLSDRYTGEGGQDDSGEIAPKVIDFKALHAENPDVVGWIYCEDTVIDYPVVQGKDNDQYLYHDYSNAYNIDGSIFVDADNEAEFVDANTIVYGHHMNSGSMFAGLVNWADQDYYEKHPIIWLMTPEQDYKIELFAGHHVDAYSEAYDIIHEPGIQLYALISKALSESEFKADVAPKGSLVDAMAKAKSAALSGSSASANGKDSSDGAAGESGAKNNRSESISGATEIEIAQSAVALPKPNSSASIQLGADDRYIMLSTCAYLFDNDRYVLNGKLVAVDSAGGKRKG